MRIEKNGKNYEITEAQNTWNVILVAQSSISAKVVVTKKDCPTFDDLKKFILENKIF